MAILFDDINKIITIEAPQTEITCQDLLNACREFEDDWNGIDDRQIADAEGKKSLGPGKQVGITLELLDDWRIEFESRASPTFCSVTGGNFVPSYQSGWMPVKFSTNVLVIVELDTSAVIVAGEGVGEDWSDTEKGMIRDALGVTGTKITATGGQMQTLALGIDRILGLVQENFAIRNQAYQTIQGRYYLTGATIKIYPTPTDVENDTNEIAEYTLSASYDGQGRCQEYKVKKV